MTAMTATAIVTKAYQDAQRLARFASLSADQEADGLDRLNDIINLWQTQGMKLFLDVEHTVTLAASQQLYSFMTGGDVSVSRPLEVKFASYWDSDSNSRPLQPISRQEWMALSNRTTEGSVNQYFVETLYDRLNLYLWNTPDTTAATGTLRVVVRSQATNPALISSAVVFPPEWAIALRWGLADELASGMPDATQTRCQLRAQAYREALEAWDVENGTETYFQPDPRSAHYSRFR